MLPGGDDFALKLVKGLTFHNSLPYLDISAGLGGGTSVIAQHHKVTAEGAEVDPALAEAALGLLTARCRGRLTDQMRRSAERKAGRGKICRYLRA